MSAVNGVANGVGDHVPPVGYFSAGPSKIPDEVMKKAQKEFLNYSNSGVSVMELSHRSPEYMAINDSAIASIKRILNVPDNYKIMLMAAGGQGQFAAVPLNLLSEGGSADYCVTGTWSEKAIKEAAKYGTANNVYPTKDFTSIPNENQWNRNEEADYIYYCDNETVHGLEFPFVPSTEGKFANVPVVADMSSNFMSRVFDINRFGLVYAACQKNVGPAGTTIVIARDDLIGKARKSCPTIFDYAQIAKNNSILNTPNTYSIYMTKLVLDWIEENGGLEQMEKNAAAKAKLIYDYMDESEGFYSTKIPADNRSRCNAVFRLKNGDEALESEFISAAKKKGLTGLKGHRSVGGIRASIYNAVPQSSVQALVDFMKDFKESH